MRILIISTNAIGDTYISCSAFYTLKKKFPNCKIDIVALKSCEFFLKKIPFENLFLLERKTYSDVIAFITKVRKIKYDYVFNFFPGQVNSFFFQFSSGKKKAGFRNIKKVKDWHNEDDIVIAKPSPDSEYKWKKTDNFLERISLPVKAAGLEIGKINKPKFEIPDDQKGFDIVMHFFSSDERKSLPEELIKNVIEKLPKEFPLKIALIGSKDELKNLTDIKTNSGFSLIEFSDFDKTLSIIKNCSLFIGVDSFPVHLADAYGVKTMGIFTCTDEKSVFQSMENKFILRINDIKNFKAEDLINFIRKNNLV
jgi:ADP-heptose:LPS heptosyltransferase